MGKSTPVVSRKVVFPTLRSPEKSFSPSRTYSRVDFPVPDGPNTATFSPGLTWRSTPLHTAALPG